jgi:phospholipid N-methyltransferase
MKLSSGLTLIFLQILVLCVTMYVITSRILPKKVKTYDCRIAEISPDFPPDVREQCRKLNVRKIT